jgi:hypothetical protein
MPASTDPPTPGAHDGRIVHLQRDHGRPAAGCQTDDLRIALIPGKVVLPTLTQGMKQRHCLSTRRVCASFSRAFVDVTGKTYQAEIISRRRSTGSLGDDMINVHL